MSTEQENSQPKKPRTVHVRSPYLFPVYGFGTARQIADRIERDGAGRLSEETLAIALRVSAKSSGYRLRTLTARQFGLITKQGETLSTTPLAKAILKPTSEEEKKNAMAQSFLEIPLFREVLTRFKGQPLPQGQAFRNILERELKIKSNRVSDAERVLMDSAREAGMLYTSGNKTYLTTEITPTAQPMTVDDSQERTPQPPQKLPQPTSGVPQRSEFSPSSLFSIAEQDLADFSEDEFAEIWGVLGKVIRARGKRQLASDESMGNNNTKKEDNKGSAG